MQNKPPAALMSKFQNENIGKTMTGVTGIVPFRKPNYPWPLVPSSSKK